MISVGCGFNTSAASAKLCSSSSSSSSSIICKPRQPVRGATIAAASGVTSSSSSTSGSEIDGDDDDDHDGDNLHADSSSSSGKALRVERLLANLGYGRRKECTALVKQKRLVFASSGQPAKVRPAAALPAVPAGLHSHWNAELPSCTQLPLFVARLAAHNMT